MSTHSSTTDPRRRMRSIRRLLLVIGTMTALTVLAPTVSAAPAGHPGRSIHIEKVCNPEGSACVVTRSDYGPIRTGATITYAGDSFDALVATIHAKHGTATGDCDISPIFAVDPGPGHCTFGSGTGSLRRLDVTFAVSFVDLYGDGSSLWFWDGTIETGHGRHR
jgi:hypothetical protein